MSNSPKQRLVWHAEQPNFDDGPRSELMEGLSGSLIRIVVLFVVIVGGLTCTCLGPALIENVFAVDLSEDTVDTVMFVGIWGVFLVVIAVVAFRSKIISLFSRRQLGDVTVGVNPRGDEGRQLEVIVQIPRLLKAGVRQVDLALEVDQVVHDTTNSSSDVRGAPGTSSWKAREVIEIGNATGGRRITETFTLDDTVAAAREVQMTLSVTVRMDQKRSRRFSVPLWGERATVDSATSQRTRQSDYAW